MYIILSGALVKEELQFELGGLPPAFLPIGNKRLFELQIKEIRNSNPCAKIYLSVPYSYKITPRDYEYTKINKVEIVLVDKDLSLGESIAQVLEKTPDCSRVSILYGDTLITELPVQNSCVAIGKTHDDYDWYVESRTGGLLFVWAGYFSFANKQALESKLAKYNNNFIDLVSALLAQDELAKVEVNNWLDLGHVATYYRSRSRLTTERQFNSISIHNNCLTKRSENIVKLKAEARWFQEIPSSIRMLTPNFIEDNTNSKDPYYSLEYLYFAPLNELYVHSALGKGAWQRIMSSSFKYFYEAAKIKPDNHIQSTLMDNRFDLVCNKTKSRLEEFEPNCPILFDKPVVYNGNVLPSINEISRRMIDKSLQLPSILSVVHGDYCFSNIFYDSRSRMVKMIDPRGIGFNQETTIYGDLVYDLAKFFHSAIGLYDFIIADAYRLDYQGQEIFFEIYQNDQVKHVQEILDKEKYINGFISDDIMPLVIILFLSMIPLHSDNKRNQIAFLANALRIYFDMESQCL